MKCNTLSTVSRFSISVFNYFQELYLHLFLVKFISTQRIGLDRLSILVVKQFLDLTRLTLLMFIWYNIQNHCCALAASFSLRCIL